MTEVTEEMIDAAMAAEREAYSASRAARQTAKELLMQYNNKPLTALGIKPEITICVVGRSSPRRCIVKAWHGKKGEILCLEVTKANKIHNGRASFCSSVEMIAEVTPDVLAGDSQ